jgi:hypothetical protein
MSSPWSPRGRSVRTARRSAPGPRMPRPRGRASLQVGHTPRSRRPRNAERSSQVRKAGATGLEPATSGVTARADAYDAGRRTTTNASCVADVTTGARSGRARSSAVARRSGCSGGQRTTTSAMAKAVLVPAAHGVNGTSLGSSAGRSSATTRSARTRPTVGADHRATLLAPSGDGPRVVVTDQGVVAAS